MKNDLITTVILILLFIAALWLVGQRDLQLDSLKSRMDLVERKADYANNPHITVERGTIYAGSGSITIDTLEDDK
jgi:hypothetical protein